MTETRLGFKQMCAKFDVTPRTLRYYEYIELLSPEKEGRNRFYTPREVARMTLIMRGRRFGFSLEDIRQLLNMYERDDSELKQLRKTYEIALERLADMERQRDELTEAIIDLKKELAWGESVLRQSDKPAAAE